LLHISTTRTDDTLIVTFKMLLCCRSN